MTNTNNPSLVRFVLGQLRLGLQFGALAERRGFEIYAERNRANAERSYLTARSFASRLWFDAAEVEIYDTLETRLRLMLAALGAS